MSGGAKKDILLNVSVSRAVLNITQDFIKTLIIEYIYYMYRLNHNKPVYLKTDTIHNKVPFISRSGLAKKILKLALDKHIVMKKGEGRQYHKVWYSLSPELYEACEGKGEVDTKVYYNVGLADANIEASVVYATIISLLKPRQANSRTKATSEEAESANNTLTLDTKKLVEGTGLSIARVRRAVSWLIDNKMVKAKKVFGNKLEVSLPMEYVVAITDREAYFNDDPPTESYPHDAPEEPPTESFKHR